MGTSKKQKKREWLRHRNFVLSPYGIIKIKSFGYIENQLHWVLDVVLREDENCISDAYKIRRQRQAEVMQARPTQEEMWGCTGRRKPMQGHSLLSADERKTTRRLTCG